MEMQFARTSDASADSTWAEIENISKPETYQQAGNSTITTLQADSNKPLTSKFDQPFKC